MFLERRRYLLALARMTKLLRTQQFIIYFLSVLTLKELSSFFIALKKDTLGLSVYSRFVFQNKINSLPFTAFFFHQKKDWTYVTIPWIREQVSSWQAVNSKTIL